MSNKINKFKRKTQITKCEPLSKRSTNCVVFPLRAHSRSSDPFSEKKISLITNKVKIDGQI